MNGLKNSITISISHNSFADEQYKINNYEYSNIKSKVLQITINSSDNTVYKISRKEKVTQSNSNY